MLIQLGHDSQRVDFWITVVWPYKCHGNLKKIYKKERNTERNKGSEKRAVVQSRSHHGERVKIGWHEGNYQYKNRHLENVLKTST